MNLFRKATEYLKLLITGSYRARMRFYFGAYQVLQHDIHYIRENSCKGRSMMRLEAQYLEDSMKCRDLLVRPDDFTSLFWP